MNTRTRELIARLGRTQQPVSDNEVAELRARLTELPHRPSRGLFWIPLPQAVALAESRGIRCATVDLQVLRGEREPELTLFAA